MVFKRALPWLPVLVWMGLIFTLSSQPRDSLVPVGNSFIEVLFDFIGKYHGDKVIHAFLYFTLALFYLVARPHHKKETIIIAILYGMSDEYHQSFVPGRSCDIFDLIADSAGAFIALYTYPFIQGKRPFSLRTPPLSAGAEAPPVEV